MTPGPLNRLKVPGFFFKRRVAFRRHWDFFARHNIFLSQGEIAHLCSRLNDRTSGIAERFGASNSSYAETSTGGEMI